MKILHTETLPKWGGQQRKVLNELLIELELGHTPYLICNPGAEIGKKARQAGIDTYEIKMNKKNYFKTVPYMIRFLKEKDIDIVISNGSTDSWIVAIAGIFSRVKKARERHNEYKIKGFLSKLLHKKLFDRIIAVSPNVKEYLIKIGVPSKKITLIESAIDVSIFERENSTFRNEFSIPLDAIVVGIFSTSLRKDKGVFDFMKAVSILLKKHQNLYIVFSGDYVKETKNQVETYFIEKGLSLRSVIWTGFRKDVPNIIKSFDIGIYPSHSEGLPFALIEQMASSIPCVVYDIPPMNELVKNGYSGFAVPFGDTNALAVKTDILIQNGTLRKQFGLNAHQTVVENYDISILKIKFDTFLREIIDAK